MDSLAWLLVSHTVLTCFWKQAVPAVLWLWLYCARVHTDQCMGLGWPREKRDLERKRWENIDIWVKVVRCVHNKPANTVDSVLHLIAVQNLLCWLACFVLNGPPSPKFQILPSQLRQTADRAAGLSIKGLWAGPAVLRGGGAIECKCDHNSVLYQAGPAVLWGFLWTSTRWPYFVWDQAGPVVLWGWLYMRTHWTWLVSGTIQALLSSEGGCTHVLTDLTSVWDQAGPAVLWIPTQAVL